jgi:hypothetical protein
MQYVVDHIILQSSSVNHLNPLRKEHEMLSSRAKGWKWYDWILFLGALLLLCPIAAAIISAVSPSGAHAVHTAAHTMAGFLQLAAGALNGIAGWLNSL